ncbi:hypothetical protein EJB05_40443, partial [Eragrostis curvula]
MPNDRRSSKENVKKKAKVQTSSSKDGSGKDISGGRSRAFDADATSIPPSKAPTLPSKDASTRSGSDQLTVSYRPPKVYHLMDMLTNPSGGSKNSSKTLSASKEIPLKSSAGPAKAKAKIQDKDAEVEAFVPAASGSEAKIQDKDSGEGATFARVSSSNMSELRQMAANLGPLSYRSGVQLPLEPHVQPREILNSSAGGQLFLHSVFEAMLEEFLPFDVTFDSVEAAEGSSLSCDEVPANTFVMSAQAVEPFVVAANRIRLPQVEDELMLQGGDTLYKSLLSSQVKYRELSKVRSDRDTLRKDLASLETKVKEKEEALVVREKRLSELSSEKEALLQSAKEFKEKVTSLDWQVEELNTSLAKAVKDNEELIAKVDAADREVVSLAEAEKLRLADLCGQVRAALVFVGAAPVPLPEDASTEHFQGWLAANVPYVIEACRAFSKNAVQLAVRDVLYSLEAGGSDACAKAASDSFSFVTTNNTPPALVEAFVKFAENVDESFWSRVLSIGKPPQSEDSSGISLSEFATLKVSSNAALDNSAASESSSDVSLSEFATPERMKSARRFIVLKTMLPEGIVAAETEGLENVAPEGVLLPVGCLLRIVVVVLAAVNLLVIAKVLLRILMLLRKLSEWFLLGSLTPFFRDLTRLRADMM